MYPRLGVSSFSDAPGAQNERRGITMIKAFLSLVAIYFLATIAAIIGVTAGVATARGIYVAGDNMIHWLSRWYRQRKSVRPHLTPAA
jgi:hypothetical protein